MVDYSYSSVQEMLDVLGITEEELRKLGLWDEYQQTIKQECDSAHWKGSTNMKKVCDLIGEPLRELADNYSLVGKTRELASQARDSSQQATFELKTAHSNIRGLLQREKLRGIPIEEKKFK